MQTLDEATRGAQTRRQVRMLRAFGGRRRRGRVPKQIYPKSIELEYAKALLVQLGQVRIALAPLRSELRGLLADSKRERGDAGEGDRTRDLIDKARRHLASALNQREIEAVARKFAERTQTYQRVQLGRQVRAALGADVFASDKRIPALVDHFVSENSTLIRDLPEQTLSEIARLVTRAVTTGQPSADLADDIDDRLDVGESRARLIARDQIGKLYGQTNAYRQQDLGITSFIWRTAGDERVRPEHDALDGQEFRYDDPPSEGLPGEPIQCRCYAEPVFDGLIDDDA